MPNMKKLCLLLSTPTINAQDNTSHLLSLLNAVPDVSDLPQYELVMIAERRLQVLIEKRGVN